MGLEQPDKDPKASLLEASIYLVIGLALYAAFLWLCDEIGVH